jgi:chromosome segregation ATPase
LSDINSQLQFLDKEIRKLWDLSNKRNKVKIAELNQDIEKQTNALKELAATQTNDQKNINAIQQESQKLSILVDELSRSNKENLNTQNKIAELSRSILLLEETVQAFDAYRKQNNELLQELQIQLASKTPAVISDQ